MSDIFEHDYTDNVASEFNQEAYNHTTSEAENGTYAATEDVTEATHTNENVVESSKHNDDVTCICKHNDNVIGEGESYDKGSSDHNDGDHNSQDQISFVGKGWDCTCDSCLCNFYAPKGTYNTDCFYCGHPLSYHRRR